ncbi:MAG: SLC13/DASS family transporter [Dehalococcoidia bacterium]|jgi:solute carrier family 13 (sodium-dependent dicarboxylate transporter), member 2/3/5|nr:SLC13/DASS family transporter [Dehalococcoidia bacterium]
MADREPVVEPEGRDAERRTRWPVVLLALLVALVASQFAPDAWPDDDARLVAHYLGSEAFDEAVRFDGEPIELAGAAGNVEVALSFVDGLTSGEPLRGGLRVARDGDAFQPDLGDIELWLELSDGRSERVPAVRWDEEAGALVVARRPPIKATIVLGVLALVVVLWVSEAIPLFVTALCVPVVLVVAGVQPADDALAPFFHPIIALFFGGFLMAEAMRRVGLDRLAALNLVARFGRTPATLFAAMIAVSAFLSMWMSNTAATAVLVPIALAVTDPFKSDAGGPGYRRAVVLGIAYAATIGGVGSAIGTPANPLAIEFLSEFVGREISFVEWFAFGLPLVVLFLPLMGGYLWWRLDASVEAGRFAAARAIAQAQLAEAGRPGRDQLAVLAVFIGVMAVWLTQTWHGTNTGIVALGGAVALALLRYVRQEDLARISWPSLITFGGGLALGVALVESGTADWVAAGLGGLAEVPAFVAVLAVALLALGLTTVASNTASAAMLVPMAIPLAGVLGLDPVLLVATVAVASSIDFALVIGTPPTMIAYSTQLFTAPQIFRVGAILDATGVLLLVTAVVAFWRFAGLV